MKIVEDEVFCTACGKMVEARIGLDNFNLLKKDLDNYKKYKDIFVYSCPMCDFVSSDISSEEGVIYGKFKDKIQEYKLIYNYADLEGLDKDLYDFHSAEVPANLYEAYSLIAKVQENYEKCIRLLNKTIELKKIMARKYRASKAELGGEEGNNEEYDKLNDLIYKSIDNNIKQIVNYYKKCNEKHIFLKLLYIETLANACQKEEALKEFVEVKRKNNVEKDLINYFEGLLTAK